MVKRITALRRHGSKEWTIAVSPEQTLRQHRAFLKQWRHMREHPDVAEVGIFAPVKVFKCRPGKLKLSQAPAAQALPPEPKQDPAPKAKAKRVSRKSSLAARLVERPAFVDTGA